VLNVNTVVNFCLCPLLSSPLIAQESPSSQLPQLENLDLTIRSLIPQDLNGLAEVLTESFHSCEGLMSWTYPLFKLGVYEDLRTRWRSPHNPHHLCLVAIARGANLRDQEMVIGTAEIAVRSLFSWSELEPEYPYISNLAVSPNYRRKGVGRKLLQRCEQAALEWGFSKISLHVLENNQQAKQLYLTNGYHVHKVESSLSNWLFKRPRRLLLKKQISTTLTS
jgi:ribosomal protein S18 acetylase RimI-like enzyme